MSIKAKESAVCLLLLAAVLMGCKSSKTSNSNSASGNENQATPKTTTAAEGLIVKVFDTPYYVFATSGIVQTAKYKIEEDQTFFAPDTNLFKNNLKLSNPKAGSKIDPSNIEVKWDSYPDATYYKFSVFADSSSGAATDYDYINKRIDGLSYVLDKPLSPGSYTCKVEAFNSNDIKLAQSSSDIKFTVKGPAAK